jgi:hypothetical protein
LHVDAHDNVLTAGQRLAHLPFGDAFVVVVDDGVLEQLGSIISAN